MYQHYESGCFKALELFLFCLKALFDVLSVYLALIAARLLDFSLNLHTVDRMALVCCPTL